ncbi:MAG: GMC family oxidoreductase N-terminal domain-containing protein [Deltaproteobacteria bacterium]|jgi:choline dehydrogenase-like flavoprotein
MLEMPRSPRITGTTKVAHPTVPTAASHPADRASIDPAAWRSALALAEAIVPGGGDVRRADEDTLRGVAALLEHTHSYLAPVWSKAAIALDHLAIAQSGHRFRNLSRERQQALLQRWSRDPALAAVLQAFAFPIKFVHFDRKDVYEGLGGRLNVVKNLEPVRWASQVIDADTYADEDDVECEVVVVGTGAGGAVVGRELAERGYAVVFVEEGRFVRRDEFTGSSVQAHQNLYRGAVSLGNNVIPLFVGRLVGGSTAVNGGTSFRTPPWVLDRWCEEMRTDELSSAAMARHFDRVEEILQVQPADRRFIGKIQDVFARGCDAHGWSHFVINRNAPGCEGSGFCDFGCRTDARRSTNISYVPPALEKGAMLFTKLRAERILLERGRAVGVEGVSPKGRKIRVRARAVVFAGGAIPTPLFLQRQGLCNSSGQVGRNLTLHPSGGLAAMFDEELNGKDAIPQGYGCDEFVKDGILLTAAQPDVNFGPIVLPYVGDPLIELMNSMSHLASFGILIADHGTGRVVTDAEGIATVHYNLDAEDLALYHRGTVKMGEICWAAGAKRVMPTYAGGHDYRSRAEWKRFVDHRPRASELLLTSYHPLGTCRMGTDPKTSVVGLDHETHDVPGLFLVDGSTVRGPLGVNPQLTIMAIATRAAEKIAQKL